MTNEEALIPYIRRFAQLIDRGDFVIDKSGARVVEQLAVRLELDPLQEIIDLGVKKTNAEYVKKELAWYLSQDLNIRGWVDDVEIWHQVADKHGFVNSNYGWCIFSEENYLQYDYAVAELQKNPASRKASMIYTRPSMIIDWNTDGRSDTMCTMYVQLFIRDGRLVYIIHQRSVDAYFGFYNDLAWAQYVYRRLLADLSVEPGRIVYVMDSFHVYERHFDLTKKIIKQWESTHAAV